MMEGIVDHLGHITPSDFPEGASSSFSGLLLPAGIIYEILPMSSSKRAGLKILDLRVLYMKLKSSPMVD